MSCNVKVTEINPTIWPYSDNNPGVPGADVFISAKIEAICDDERSDPELRPDEDLSWMYSFGLTSTKSYARGLTIVDATGDEQDNSGWIISIGQQIGDKKIVNVRLQLATNKNGKQSVDVRVMCRCHPNDPWTRLAVDINFTV